MFVNKYWRTISVALAMVFIFGIMFTGCGNGAQKSGDETSQQVTTAAASETKSVEPVEVTLTTWSDATWKGVFSPDEDNAQYGDWYKYVADEFSKANPGVTLKVEYEQYEASDLYTKYNVALASNSLPDFRYGIDFTLYDQISKGAVLPLDDTITDDLKNAIPDNIWKRAQQDGKTYFLPMAGMPASIMVNKTLFEKAGILDKLPLGKDDRTWTNDEFKDALKAITQNGKADVYGYGICCAEKSGDFANWVQMWSYGASSFTDDFTSFALNNENGVKALDFYKSLVDEKLTEPSPYTTKWGDLYNLFMDQKLAMFPADPSTVPQALKDMKDKGISFDIDQVMFPSGDGIPKTMGYCYALAALKTNDEIRMMYTKKYLVFASKPEYAKAWTNLSLPYHKDIANILDDKYEWKVAKNFNQYIKDLGSRVPGYSEIRDQFFPELQAVYTGEKTSKQALDELAQKVNDIIQKNKS